SRAEPNTPSSCELCRAICQNALMPRAGSCPRRKPREPSDIIPRCRSLIPPCATQKREKVDDFYAARSRTIPPLPWSSFPPPFSTLITPRNFDRMQMMTVEMEPGSKSSPGFYRHEGIDVGYILSGSLNLEVDGRTHVLSVGDCFAFDSQLPHRFENRGGTRAEVLWINTKSRLTGLPPVASDAQTESSQI